MFELYLKEAIILSALISMPPLLISMVCGMIVALLQAATQIQEQSVSYIVRLSTIGGIFILGSEFFWQKLVQFFVEVLQTFPSLGKM